MREDIDFFGLMAEPEEPEEFVIIISDYRPLSHGSATFRRIVYSTPKEYTRQEWLRDKIDYAVWELSESISVDPLVLGGTPTLRGTRMPMSRILAEIGDGLNITEIAEDCELDAEAIKRFIDAFAMYLDQSFVHVSRISTRQVQ